MKRFIQSVLKRVGYRLVPHARDPEAAMDLVFAHPVDLVIDVGANTGNTCEQWLTRFPNATVYAFEPLPDLVRTIRARTIRDKDRITVFQVAASDTVGQTHFSVHTDHPSSSSLRAATDTAQRLMPFTGKTENVTVATDTLDNVIASTGAQFSEALLKLDVQGHELSVLEGARATLPSVRFVLTEINLQPLYEGQPTLLQITAFLADFGFRFIGVAEQFHLDSGRPIFLDALFERTG